MPTHPFRCYPFCPNLSGPLSLPKPFTPHPGVSLLHSALCLGNMHSLFQSWPCVPLCEVLPVPKSALSPPVCSPTLVCKLQGPGPWAARSPLRPCPSADLGEQACGQCSLSEDGSGCGHLLTIGLSLFPEKDPLELGPQDQVSDQCPRSSPAQEAKGRPHPKPLKG